MTTNDATKTKKKFVKILTPEFRVSWPQVFEAKAVNPGDKLKFSVQMLFRLKPNPKDATEKVLDAATLTPLKEAVKALLIEKLGAGWATEVVKKKVDGSPMYRLPFHDGKEKDMDGYGEGVMFCTATSVLKPGLVDGSNQAIISPSEFYGGCYARATVNPFWYDIKGNKGVALGLLNIQKLRDGMPFSGRSKPEDDFDAIETPGGATAASAGAVSADNPMGIAGL